MEKTPTEDACQLSNSGTVGESECVRYGRFADNIAWEQRADSEFELPGGFNGFGVGKGLGFRGKAANPPRSIAQALLDPTCQFSRVKSASAWQQDSERSRREVVQ